MTHQHTWNTIAGTSSFFAVKAALVGDEFQQNFAAILSVAAVLLGFYFQIQERRRTNRLADLIAERDEAKVQAEIERIKRDEPPLALTDASPEPSAANTEAAAKQ